MPSVNVSKSKYPDMVRICPFCGVRALSTSLFDRNKDHCFEKRGGCGITLDSLMIRAKDLERGVALAPYKITPDTYSPFGNHIHRLKYLNISESEKAHIVNEIWQYVDDNHIVSDLIPEPFRQLLVVMPIPATKLRTYQHVYELAKSIANPRYPYIEELKKQSSSESKSAERSAEFLESDFSCSPLSNLQNVLLIDDTYGTGATLRGSIRTLKASGVNKIFFLSVCKNMFGGMKA